jgi:hypothetical protein
MHTDLIHLLAEESNGAVEVDNPVGVPLMICLIGPIKVWWGKLDSDEYREYAAWRDAVRVALIHQGHLVYSPHRAWQGAWHERAQLINDQAVALADAVIAVTPDGVLAEGTAAEIAVAEANGVPVFTAPPASDEDLLALVNTLQQHFSARE